jgi:hypothetical protein
MLKQAIKKISMHYGISAMRRAFGGDGAIKKVGWDLSVKLNKPVDAEGAPIPWMSYPAIHFLDIRLNKALRLFEYGAGGSTHWFAKRVAQVSSLEHDSGWVESVRENIPGNVTLLHKAIETNRAYYELSFGDIQESNDYVNAILDQEGEFDVIVIDGVLRNACMKVAVTKLSRQGVFVVDNSGMEEFRPGIDFLRQSGFREVPFQGMYPIDHGLNCTSIFYRDNNCMGI